MLKGGHHPVVLVFMADILREVVEVSHSVVLVYKLLSFLPFGYADIILSSAIDVD